LKPRRRLAHGAVVRERPRSPPQARIDRWPFLSERIGTAAPADEERTTAANAPPRPQPQMTPYRRR
jgi:hypothetical protein